MLPFLEHPSWQLGPVTVHAFGLAVAVAFWVGSTTAQREFAHRGLDPALGHRLSGWIVAGGILGAHLFSVVLYFPGKLRQDPWLLLRVWEDISSFGGMLGGVAGAYAFFAAHLGAAGLRHMVAYLDAIAYVFPGALAIGRIGCAFAHDHPGAVTSFPLAVSLKTDAARQYLVGVYDAAGEAWPSAAIGFHDLGLYEFLYLAAVVVPAFLYWHRVQRPTGFYLVAFAALYFPVRFGFDMLRVADERYLGLTPAQWGAATILAGLPFAALRQRRLRFALCGAVILLTACACWSGT